MKRSFITILVISLSLILVGACLTGYAMITKGGFITLTKQIVFNDNNRSSIHTLEGKESAQNIRLSFINSSIKLSKYNGNTIKITYSQNSRYKYIVKNDSNGVSIAEMQRKLFNFGDFGFSNVKVLIPNRALNEVDLETVNGKISISGLSCNKLNDKTVNGVEEIHDLSASDMSSNSVNGNSTIQTLGFTNLTIKKVNGKANLNLVGSENDYSISKESVNGQLFINDQICGRGNVEINHANSRANIKFNSVNGDLIIKTK